MATQIISTTFQFKRGYSDAWESKNPILAPGEPGWTLDTHVLKIGDGITPWNDLEPISGEDASEVFIKSVIDNYFQEETFLITGGRAPQESELV